MRLFPIIDLFVSGVFFVIFCFQSDFSLKSSGGVTDMMVVNDLLYAATDNGTVDIFSLTGRKSVNSIKVPNIVDFMGDEIPAKVHSVDVWGNGNVMMVCQGQQGFRNVFTHVDGSLLKVLDAGTDKMMIKKARFISESRILLASLSNEIILYDLKEKEKIFTKQISSSTFSDFQLSEDRSSGVFSDESGIIRMLETNNGNLIKELKGENVDNVYQVDLKNNVVLGAGQDRRVSVYTVNTGMAYHFESDFLVYSVGLSPSGSVAAYQANEENEIVVFSTRSKRVMCNLQGHKSTITKIVFLSETELISSSDDPEIHFWKINH